MPLKGCARSAIGCTLVKDMRVTFYGIYRLVTGLKTVEFELEPAETLRSLLQAVIVRFPALKVELFDGNGNLYASIPLYLNGRNPRLLEGGLDTEMHAEDVLSLFSPISSGRINVEIARSP
jgi:molybdopterin synthase sulfur carrier subunit